jgi:hypothetical protein
MSLLASQVLGLIVARYLLEMEPLASMPAAHVVTAMAPNLQHFLEDPLP